MRLDYLKLKGIGPFRDEVEVDLTKLPLPGLVAVVGPNGAGKSTLLEVGLPGAMDRSTPTRGSLLDLATGRDSFVEARLTNGSSWTLRHLLDGVSGKSEALVLKDGEPVLPDTKVRSFDRWRAEHLPSSEVLFASTFSAQDTRGFLEASRTERVGVILRLVQAAHLEGRAELARKRATAARADLQTLAARIADERARAGDVAKVEAELAGLRQGVQSARDELARLTAEHAEAAELYRVYREELSKAVELRHQREAVTAEHGKACTKLLDLEDRARNNRAVIAQGADIRAAVERTEAIRARLAEIDAELAKLKALADSHRAAAVSARQARNAAAARVEAANKRLASAAGLQLEAESVGERQTKHAELTQEMADAEADLTDLRGRRVAGAEERVTALRAGLSRIVETHNEGTSGADCPAEALAEIAVTTIETDDETARDAKSLPAELAEAERLVKAARERLAAAARAVASAEAAAARLPDLEAAKKVAEAAELEVKAAAEQAARSDQGSAEAEALAEPLSCERAQLVKERDGLAPLVAKQDPLARAEARLAELEPQVAAAAAELAELKAKLEVLPEPAPLTAVAEPKPFDSAGAEGFIESLVKRVAGAEANLETARAGAARVAELEAQQREAELDLSDWNQLAADLGKDGIQAMEVDAAGPELTELTNDLLHRCHGPRFTVRIDTQRASADGKRLLEGCDVNVLDTLQGRDAEGSTFSGGEKVILSEALSLALAMYGCQRSGETEQTLVRDESGAALDPEATGVYAAMLRRAAEVVNARVLVVSHTPALWDLCDALITVRERGIEVGA